MASAPSPVTSPPDVPGQPYDAADDGPLGKWVSVNPQSGPCDLSGEGNATGSFESGPGPWRQT
jgi:hypothetical protein